MIKAMTKPQGGFTLIELVIVISIIAVLAATALPRYVTMQREARVAKAQAIYGAIRAASVLGHAGCLLNGAGSPGANCTAATPTVDMEGTAVSVANLYPAASLTGIIAATQLSESGDQLTITAGNPITVDINGAATAALCRISYTAATAGPPIVAPVITLTTTGC